MPSPSPRWGRSGWTLQQVAGWEKFWTVKLLRFQEVPFCETNGFRNCLFNFLSLCWLSVFLDQPKIKSKKALKMFVVVFGRSRQGFASWQTCLPFFFHSRFIQPNVQHVWSSKLLVTFNRKPTKTICWLLLAAARSTVTQCFHKSERPQRKAKVADCVVIHGKGGKDVWSEAKAFRIGLKIGTEIWLGCHWIWSLLKLIWHVQQLQLFHSVRYCACDLCDVCCDEPDYAFTSPWPIWLWAKKAPNRPLSESCVLCEAVLLSSPKMAAFSFAFITFAMLASQSASTRSHENHGMLMTPEEAQSFLELHQQFMFAPISHPHHGKNGNKRDCCFFSIFPCSFSWRRNRRLLQSSGRNLPQKSVGRCLQCLQQQTCSTCWNEDWLQIHLSVVRFGMLCQNNRRCDIDYRKD